MTDRKLLEKAAKAAGMWKKLFSLNDDDLPDFNKEKGFRLAWGKGWWNPLTDDGDALRLAVKLGIFVQVLPNESRALLDEWVYELHDSNPYAATRRAIVRAAAAIGETL